ncbi:MAG: PPC domain-containing protein [Phormidesmis sp.]
MTLGKVSAMIGGFSLGVLMLSASPVQAQSSPPVYKLGVLDTADTQLADGSYFDSYEIAGSAGQRVSISLDSSEFDTFLGLLDSDGNLIVSNDDASESNLNSYISLTLPTDGTYTVVATSFDPLSNGGYRLSMRNFNAPRATMQSGQSGLEPVFNPLATAFIGAALNELFFGGGSSVDSYSDPSQDPALREAERNNRYRPTPQPAPRPVTPIGGNCGFYGGGC